MSRQRQILHADFESFYIAVERALNPRLQARPLVVGNTANRRGVVGAVSAEARRYGIYPAMTTSSARARCADLAVVEGDFTLYRRASGSVGKYLRQFTPWFESNAVDTAFLDLTGTQQLFGPAVDVGLKLQRGIRKRFSLNLTVGVAGNKLISRLASRSVRPTGLCEITPGSETAFLHPLPVRRLPDIGPQAEKRLGEFNVLTVAELAALSRSFLIGEFGRRGETMFAQARGIDNTPVRQRPGPTTIDLEETLTNDTNDRDILSALLFRLVEAAGRELRAHRLTARRVRVAVGFIDNREAAASRTLSLATDLDSEMYSGAESALIRTLASRTAVRKISLRLSRLTYVDPQLALIDDGRDYDRRRALTDAVDRIRLAYGVAAVFYGRGSAGKAA